MHSPELQTSRCGDQPAGSESPSAGPSRRQGRNQYVPPSGPGSSACAGRHVLTRTGQQGTSRWEADSPRPRPHRCGTACSCTLRTPRTVWDGWWKGWAEGNDDKRKRTRGWVWKRGLCVVYIRGLHHLPHVSQQFGTTRRVIWQAQAETRSDPAFSGGEYRHFTVSPRPSRTGCTYTLLVSRVRTAARIKTQDTQRA